MFFFIIVASRNALLDDLCFKAFSSRVLQIKKLTNEEEQLLNFNLKWKEKSEPQISHKRE